MAQQTSHRFLRLTLILGALALLSTAAFAQIPTGVLSDQKPASVLFFNRYTSNPSNPQMGDTQINITNTNQSASGDIAIHLFLVDGGTCSVADAFVTLTQNQTASFLLSDFDPGVQGYIIAVASSGGTPTQFNWLIGDEYIRESDGRVANLAAVGVAKISPGDIAPGGDGTASLVFDGAEYERLPASVAISSFNSQTTDATHLYIYSPTNNLISGAPSSVSAFTLVYDDAEHVLSTTIRFTCYGTFALGSLRLAGGSLNLFVPAGRTGWMRFNGGGRPLLGAVLNRGPVFLGGHNLHHLSLLPSYSISVPAF